MRRLGWVMVLSLLCTAVQAATPANAVSLFNPRSACEPGTEYAKQQLARVIRLLDYAGEEIMLCRSSDVPLLYAWISLDGYEQHPFIGWKKTPVVRHHISYNPGQLSRLRDDNLIAALLAKQIGHLIKGHRAFDRPFDSFVATLTENAEADYFAGMALGRAGLGEPMLWQTLNDYLAMVPVEEDADLNTRLRAFADGVQAGGGPALSLAAIEAWRQDHLAQRQW